MPRSPTTGDFVRVSNSFSEPIYGTVIDPSDADALFNDYDTGLTFDDASPLILIGSTSGVTTFKAADTASGTITFPAGTTDFSATGGTGQFVKQASAGAPFTVATVPASEIASPAALTRTDDTNVTLTLGGAPSTALLAATSLTMGWTGQLSGARGGTGIDNTGKTITLGGNLTTSGAFSTTFTVTGNTGVTLPTTGTLATLAGAETLSNKTLTASAITSSTIGNTNTVTLTDNNFTLQANGATTKQGVFSLASITAGQTRTMTVPDASFTLAGSNLAQTWSANQTFNSGTVLMAGSSSGTQVWRAAATASGTITLPAGTVDFSATGGTGQVVKQTSAGGIFTVGSVGASELSGLGTGVATALAVNVGTAGAIVVNGGALGTPSSGTLTSATGLPISTGLTGAGTGVLTALGVNVGTSGSFVVNGGALGSPSSAGTIPAFTLGGTISGGGNQINNVVIGTSTPLAGSFTTLAGSTSTTTPTVIGGTGTGSSLSLQSTSGVGATDFIKFAVGNNGATEAGRFITGGNLLMGSTASVTVGGSITGVIQIFGTGAAGAMSVLRQTTPGGGGALAALGSSRGTPSTGSFSALQSGDGLGSFVFFGDDGVDVNQAGASIFAQADATWSSGSSAGRLVFNTVPSGSNTAVERMRVANGGNIYMTGAGTTASAANAFLDSGSTPANELLRSTSSIRYKRDVEDLDFGAAQNLLKARPVWYRSAIERDRQDHSHYGLIAEELAEIDPRLVQWGYTPEAFDHVEIKDEDGKVTSTQTVLKKGAVKVPDGVTYDRLTVLLLKLVQDLTARVETLETQLKKD